MKYLQALGIIENNKYKKTNTLNITTSFFSDLLNTFLKAHFYRSKIKVKIINNEFNTLKQTLLKDNKKDEFNLIILTPWDFCDQINFREGTQLTYNYFKDIKNEINQFFNFILKKKKNNKIVFCDFPYPKILINENENYLLENFIRYNAANISDLLLGKDYFNIERFFEIGFPISTSKLSKLSKLIVNLYTNKKVKKIKTKYKRINKKYKNYEVNSKKILATDFDGVLWKGLIADDGYKNIICNNDHIGFKHFLYQKLLLRLKKQGVLLVGITRNNISDALDSFKNKDFILKKKDFVKISASYKKKSESIRAVCDELNMSLSNVLFIDDNILEVTEVKKNLPEVKSLLFPHNSNEIINFLNRISDNFQKNYLTKEDKNRVINYQKNKNLNIEYKKTKSNFNLDKFLKSLKMKLKIVKKKHNKESLERPFQLINKTNQFNINGNRLNYKQFKDIIEKRGTLFSASYKDNTGEYGEVITLLADNKRNIVSFVMSCRVFQRKIELEFLRILIKNGFKINKFLFKKTKKNEPFKIFYDKFLSNSINPNTKKFNNENFIKKTKFSKEIFSTNILNL